MPFLEIGTEMGAGDARRARRHMRLSDHARETPTADASLHVRTIVASLKGDT